MIPKIIHYCWFGRNPLPPLAIKCIESWKKYFPDYEIKEWNEDNFDINMITYTQEAYKAQKYAFVSDYARFWILYNYGGIYFDTDVEVIKSFDDIILCGPFMGCETDASDVNSISVAPGLGLGVNSHHIFYEHILEIYKEQSFIKKDGSLNLKTVVSYTTELLYKFGLENIKGIQECAGISIYPVEYFCPISVKDGKLRITDKTHSIHHYSQSWQSPIRKYGRKILLFLGGSKLKDLCKRIFNIK